MEIRVPRDLYIGSNRPRDVFGALENQVCLDGQGSTAHLSVVCSPVSQGVDACEGGARIHAPALR